MSNPKLTVGIPVYNGQDSLGKCLDSILAQTFTDFEVMILDNASTDGTPELIRRYAERDSRIKWAQNRSNLGQSVNSYRLMYGTTTEFYALVHADLQWKPTFAEKCLEALEKDQEAVVAYPQCQFVDEKYNNLDLYRDTVNFAENDLCQRFVNVVTGLGWCTAWHGVMRTDILHIQYYISELLNNGNPAGDNLILAALALHGKFVQVEEPLLIRKKGAYQVKQESPLERYTRLCWKYARFPFCNFIKDHMKLVDVYCGNFGSANKQKNNNKELCEDEDWWSEATAKADSVVNKIIGPLLAMYRPYIEFEIDHTVDLIKTGNIHRQWLEAKEGYKRLECKTVGRHRTLDFVVLTQMNENLDFAYSLIPDHPGLHYARGMVKMWLGRPDEALLAIKRELKNDPVHLKSLEMLKHLEKVLAN